MQQEYIKPFVMKPVEGQSYDNGVIYKRTRRAVAAQRAEDFRERDGREIKNRFLQAIGWG